MMEILFLGVLIGIPIGWLIMTFWGKDE